MAIPRETAPGDAPSAEDLWWLIMQRNAELERRHREESGDGMAGPQSSSLPRTLRTAAAGALIMLAVAGTAMVTKSPGAPHVARTLPHAASPSLTALRTVPGR
jgi:hypothetical protein